MPDEKPAPIAHITACKVGAHAFTWSADTSSTVNPQSEPYAFQRCDCGTYTWAEWQKAQETL